MRSFPECISCVVKQVLNTARYVTDHDNTLRFVRQAALMDSRKLPRHEKQYEEKRA